MKNVLKNYSTSVHYLTKSLLTKMKICDLIKYLCLNVQNLSQFCTFFGSEDKQIGFIQIFTKDEETKVKIIINAYEENYRVKVIDNYSMKADCNDLETLEMISNFLVLSLKDRLKDEKEHKRRERESLLKDL